MPQDVLCVYATRQIDSNLLMSGTVFHGLSLCDFPADALFCGPKHEAAFFKATYGHRFRRVYILPLGTSLLAKLCARTASLRLLYSFYIHFFKDGFWRPYSLRALRRLLTGGRYTTILSFIPPVFSGRLGCDVHKLMKRTAPRPPRLIQFWTDPLSIGACDRLEDIPWRRFLHKLWEHRLLAQADKAVFCYPLLCEMEQKLHPQFAHKMTWSDVGYIEHKLDAFQPHNPQVTIGLFGAYQRNVRNIEPLLAALRHFPDARFILRGDSDVVIDPAAYPNLDVLPGRRPVDEVEQLEAQCDILLCLGAHCGMTIPAGKVFYYASYHKPILYISDGVHGAYCRRYLEAFGRYLTCDNTEASICDGLQRALDALKTYQHHIPERMRLDAIARKLIETP